MMALVNGGNGELSTEPLSEAELKAIRRIIRDDDRARWFWREIRRWGGYGAVAVTSIYASWDVMLRFFSALTQTFRGHP